ncbi:MAG: hypothetical protein II920_10920 [Clostridia bacterium]|nr:hypothetical protein [Clostridia bacterium]
MDVSASGADAVFRTAFSPEYDLIQIMRGLKSVPGTNSPVDFRLAALTRKGQSDIWHADRVLAFSTDECAPVVINGEDMGGNHALPCCVRVISPGHGLNVTHTGGLYRDESGLGFTLLCVEDDQSLLFISENTGASETAYAFADEIKGTLISIEDRSKQIKTDAQEGGVPLSPAIRHLERSVMCLKGGAWQLLKDEIRDCEAAEIRETYDIINPATVAESVRKARPSGGYKVQPPLNMGKAMLRHRMTYRFENDGTVVCLFDHERLADVQANQYLGIMHQLRSDAFGGGTARLIPGLKPIVHGGLSMDFSRPYIVSERTMPKELPLTRDMWQDPACPPCRQLDLMLDMNGRAKIAFASGFLPLFDGEPSVRASNIGDACTLVKSCKTYPTFAGGASGFNLARIRGAAYKKYFVPQYDDALSYTVPFGGDTYLYMDFFSNEARKIEIEAPCGSASELSPGVEWRMEKGRISAAAKIGELCLKFGGRK